MFDKIMEDICKQRKNIQGNDVMYHFWMTLIVTFSSYCQILFNYIPLQIIYTYIKEDLALNQLPRLIWHKNPPTKLTLR